MTKKSPRVRELLLATEFFPIVFNKSKTCTVRTGHRNVRPGLMTIRSADGSIVADGEDSVTVRVTGVKHTTLGELTMRDLLAEGMDATAFDYNFERMLYAFWADMGKFYPDITLESPVTVINFKLV